MEKKVIATVIQSLLLTGVQCYRLFFRAWIGPVCRFEPSCSAYAQKALTLHGAAAGSYLTLRRLVRCQPWCEGGHDPVPALRAGKGLFTRFTYQQAPDLATFCLSAKDAAPTAARISHLSEKILP